jgi:parvulin-like peptidyl-prolyl isomerase
VARAQAPNAPAASPTPAAAATVETSESADKVVLKVGDQQFTKADLDFLVESLNPQAQRAIAAQGKKPLADQFAIMVMLSQQAHLHHLDETPAFEHKLALQKRQLEAQAAFEEINQQAKVTPEEIDQYYTAHSADYDEIMVRQFTVRKKAAEPKADPAHPLAAPSPGLTPEEAKTRAEAIRKEVTAGTDIKKVVEDFKAPGDVIIETESRKVRRGGMPPEMEKVAFALKDGEVSDPVDTPQAVVVFQVTGHSHLDVKDVTPDIEKKMRQEKINAAMAEVKRNNAVWMDDQYFAAPPKPTVGAPASKTPPKP